MSLSRDHVKEQLARLAEIHALPRHWKLDQAVSRFHWVMTQPPEVHPVQLETAVGAYLKSDEEYFPKPGRLRQLALKQSRPSMMGASLKTYLDWEFGGYGRVDMADPNAPSTKTATFTPCPVCGAEMVWDDHGRLRAHHIAEVHKRAGLPVIGWSDKAEAMYYPPKDPPSIDEPTAAAPVEVETELEFTT